jgi:hypothetical protein
MWRERLRDLAPFLIAACAIAFLQWAMSREIAHHWARGIHLSDTSYLSIISLLALVWLLVGGIGFWRGGWLGALALFGIKYGLYPIWLYAILMWACGHANCV